MISRFNNSNGVGFIGFVLLIGIILLGLVVAVFGSLSSSHKEAARFRQGSTSLLVLQQLGTVALKVHNDYISDPTCGGGLTGKPFGQGVKKAFCMPVDEICISDPDDTQQTICGPAIPPPYPGTPDPNIKFEIMQTKAGVQASLDFNIRYKSKWQKWKFAYFDLVLRAQKMAMNKLSYASNILQAQVDVPFEFATAGAVPGAINIATACVGTLCKTCAPALFPPPPPGGPSPYPVGQIPCLRFRVCPKMVPCDPAVPSEWFVQKVGMIQTAANPAGPL